MLDVRDVVSCADESFDVYTFREVSSSPAAHFRRR